MNPKYPVYIISKGRWESRLTVKAFDRMSVKYKIVVEEQEYDRYAEVIDRRRILVLDEQYKRSYDLCCNLKPGESAGSGPARNFVWDHAVAAGAKRHWVVDDNIRGFMRYTNNERIYVADGTILRCMEDFTDRYENVALSGPNYHCFVTDKQKRKPMMFNTRIYSCILIKNDIPYRWRCRYNEDTDLSLRVLKDRWCTILFNTFLAMKMQTQSMRGGNTDELYRDGTREKSAMLVRLHPDVAVMKFRYGREHHWVDYSQFLHNKLVKRRGLRVKDDVDEYGMKFVDLRGGRGARAEE